uniref:HDC17435 n=1 Tax=Drosophila melanogaster TaxID=7227 RepID=Q6IIP5_DROME|nr:TPA_inf: HDC17435 [Drosophila melanogaster]
MWVAVCVVVAFEEAEEMVVEEADWVAGGRPILHMLNNLGFWCSCSQRPQEQPQSKFARPPPTHYHKQLHVQVMFNKDGNGVQNVWVERRGARPKLCVVCKTVIIHKSPKNPTQTKPNQTKPKQKLKLKLGLKLKLKPTGMGISEWVEWSSCCLCIITWFNCHGGKQINEFRSQKLCSLCNFWPSIRKYGSTKCSDNPSSTITNTTTITITISIGKSNCLTHSSINRLGGKPCKF